MLPPLPARRPTVLPRPVVSVTVPRLKPARLLAPLYENGLTPEVFALQSVHSLFSVNFLGELHEAVLAFVVERALAVDLEGLLDVPRFCVPGDVADVKTHPRYL